MKSRGATENSDNTMELFKSYHFYLNFSSAHFLMPKNKDTVKICFDFALIFKIMPQLVQIFAQVKLQ